MRLGIGRPGVLVLVAAAALAGCGGKAPASAGAAPASAGSGAAAGAPGPAPDAAAPAVAGACAREPDLPAWSGRGLADACDGLAPVAPAAAEIAFPAGSDGALCGAPSSDAAGLLAAGVQAGNHGQVAVHLWSSAGEVAAAQVGPDAAWMTPTARGFVVTSLGWLGLYPGATVVAGASGAVASKGVAPPGSYPHAHFASADGSAVEVVTRTDAARVALLAARVGPDGALAAGPWTVVETARSTADPGGVYCPPGTDCTLGAVAAGEDAAGNVLVVWDAGATCGTAGLAARWFARDGAPLGPPFVAADGVTARGAVVQPMALAPLAGGGLALRVNGAWIRRFDAPRLAGGPPPDWLAARPGRSLQVVRGGRAMALVPPRRGEAFDAAAPCGEAIEVLAPSGRSCGSAAFPGPHCDGEGALVGGEAAPSIGLDGTVVRAVGTEACAAGAAFPVCCRYRWWEGALR